MTDLPRPPAHPLVRYRRHTGMTQHQLARLLGVTPACVASYEVGRRTPRLQMAKRIEGLTRGAVTVQAMAEWSQSREAIESVGAVHPRP